MEYLSKINFGWISNVDCNGVDIALYENQLGNVFLANQSGTSIDISTPLLASLGQSFGEIQCGTGCLLYLTGELKKSEISQLVVADYKMDAGRIAMNYPQEIDVRNINSVSGSASGIYKITSFFKNSRPVYKNENDWNITYDSTENRWFIRHDLFTNFIFANCSSDLNSTFSLYDNKRIFARWDAQYLRNDNVVEEIYNNHNLIADADFIEHEDQSLVSRGKIFDFHKSIHYKNLGNILNDVFSSNNFSISVWINPKSKYALENDECCYRSNASSTCILNCNVGAVLSKSSSSQVLENDSFVIWSDGSLSTKKKKLEIKQEYNVSINQGKWNHLVYSISNGVAKIYLNGEYVSRSEDVNIQNDFQSDADDLILGNIVFQSGVGDYGYWGLLDDLRIYNQPLNYNEINKIYRGEDVSSQLPSFQIPPSVELETTIPMSEEIIHTKLTANSYGLQEIAGNLVSLIVRENNELVIEYYTINDNNLIRLENLDKKIGIYGELKDTIITFDYIQDEDGKEVLLIWSSLNYVYIFEKNEDGWGSQRLSHDYITDVSKFSYSQSEQRMDENGLSGSFDIIFILTKDNLKLYRKNFANLWSIFKVFENVENFSVKDNLLFILKNDSFTFDNFDILIYEFIDTFVLLNLDTYYGSFDSVSYSFEQLTINGDKYLAASFTDSFSSEFKFDPNDSYLKNASPAEVILYKIDKNTEGIQTRIVDTIRPPYRVSGIDYQGITNFGYKIFQKENYLIISSKNVDFVYLYEFDVTSGKFDYVTNLTFSNSQKTDPSCIINNNYCLIFNKKTLNYENSNLVNLELFNFTSDNLERMGQSFDIENNNIKVWWDFGEAHGKLDENSHIVFDKSGNFNHLGVASGYESISKFKTGAISADPIYDLSLSSNFGLQSPIDNNIFSNNFSLFIWIKDLSNVKSQVLRLSDNFDMDNFNDTEFILFSNCDVKYGDQIIQSNYENEGDWKCICVKKENNIMSVYLNTKLISTNTNVNGDFVSKIISMIQIVPESNNILIDDFRLYDVSVTSDIIYLEFERSYRDFLLTNLNC